MHVSKIKESDKLIPTNTPVLPHQAALLRYPFPNFNPIQSAIYPYCTSDVNIVIACATSAGKAQPLDSKILTSSGYVAMGSLKCGDRVIGSDGSPTTVVGVYPQGKKDVYEVVFSDNTKTQCCAEHLWNVQTRSDRCREKGFKTLQCKDLIGDLKSSDGQNKWFIPVVAPVNFDQYSDLPIDPYLLGALIGDGGIKYNVIVSISDKEILDRVERLANEAGCKFVYISQYDYRISALDKRKYTQKTNGVREFAKTNVIKYKLQRLGLFGLGSKEKFIPEQYLRSSVSSRIELLRGLMDTDGCIPDNKAHKQKRSAVFNTSSFRLANDFCDLVRSLGGVCSISEKDANFYAYKGERRKGSKSYRITVNVGSINPFYCSSKSSRFIENDKRTSKKSIERISFVGVKECQCIKVSSHDQLYVTDDFIVTHNTIAAEMFLSDSIWRGGTGLYVAPLRAVVSEKYDDWTQKDYGFGVYAKARQLNVSILTGDFRLTKDRQEELYNAHLILMTPEMLDSRCRRMQMEMNSWLNRVKTVVIDEAHLLGMEDRGHRLESAMMRFSSMNKCRIVALSATMPNVDEMARWISTLNGKPTIILESDWRPVKLTKHIVKVQIGSQNPKVKQQDLCRAALNILISNNNKTIFFVHAKTYGRAMLETLQRAGITAAFHSSSAALSERQTIEMAFDRDPNFKALVSTSTLAWGVNKPARQVVILGVKRGREDVHPYDIAQMQGRAGRFGLDPEGDAYLLLSSDTFTSDVEKYAGSALPPITSYLRDKSKVITEDDTLAFHAVSEVAETPKRADQLLDWYKRSFAFTSGSDITLVEMTDFCKHLVGEGIFYEAADYYQATNLGKIASWMYLSPFDIVDLSKNWYRVFKSGVESEAAAIAFALFNTHSERTEKQYVPLPYDLEASWKSALEDQLKQLNLNTHVHSVMCVYAQSLAGHDSDIPGEVRHMLAAHRLDMDRIVTACELIDKMHGHWNKKLFWRLLSSRVTMGVSAQQAELCMVKGIGSSYSKQLCDYGVSSLRDLADPAYRPIIQNILKNKTDYAIKEAGELLREIQNANN